MLNNRKVYMKGYFENNKERILNRMMEKINCNICDSMISRCHMNRHKLTKKCKSSVSS